MDTELAKTFLAIVSTGSFIRAAERLNVAQTTVSARIRVLEEQLGRPLFVRNKAGALMTPAGEQFLRYAPSFLHLWERARNQVAVPAGHHTVLTIGGEVSLWHPLLLEWTLWMRRSLPEIALRVHVDVPVDLITQVADGLVDVAVMYAPPNRPGLKIDLLMEEKLVLVSTDPEMTFVEPESFVSVDWGPDFARKYSSIFPEKDAPGLSVNLSLLALNYILAAGGSGYFRMHVIEKYLAAGQLHVVPDMPQFSYPIYVVSSVDMDDTLYASVVAGLRTVSSNGLV